MDADPPGVELTVYPTVQPSFMGQAPPLSTLLSQGAQPVLDNPPMNLSDWSFDGGDNVFQRGSEYYTSAQSETNHAGCHLPVRHFVLDLRSNPLQIEPGRSARRMHLACCDQVWNISTNQLNTPSRLFSFRTVLAFKDEIAFAAEAWFCSSGLASAN